MGRRLCNTSPTHRASGKIICIGGVKPLVYSRVQHNIRATQAVTGTARRLLAIPSAIRGHRDNGHRTAKEQPQRPSYNKYNSPIAVYLWQAPQRGASMQQGRGFSLLVATRGEWHHQTLGAEGGNGKLRRRHTGTHTATKGVLRQTALQRLPFCLRTY